MAGKGFHRTGKAEPLTTIASKIGPELDEPSYLLLTFSECIDNQPPHLYEKPIVQGSVVKLCFPSSSG